MGPFAAPQCAGYGARDHGSRGRAVCCHRDPDERSAEQVACRDRSLIATDLPQNDPSLVVALLASVRTPDHSGLRPTLRPSRPTLGATSHGQKPDGSNKGDDRHSDQNPEHNNSSDPSHCHTLAAATQRPKTQPHLGRVGASPAIRGRRSRYELRAGPAWPQQFAGTVARVRALTPRLRVGHRQPSALILTAADNS